MILGDMWLFTFHSIVLNQFHGSNSFCHDFLLFFQSFSSFPQILHGFPMVFALLHPPAAPRRRNIPVLRVAGGQELLEKLPRALRRVQVFVERRRDRGEMFAAYFTGQRWTLISGVKT